MAVTVRKVANKAFRHEVQDMARQLMATLKPEFSRYLPLDDADFYKKTETWLVGVMLMKLELIVSECHHKISFIPPGTPYDSDWMLPVNEDGGGVTLNTDAEHRVRICLSPALISNVAEPDWPEAQPRDRHAMAILRDLAFDAELPDLELDAKIRKLDPRNSAYRKALLETRNFFPEKDGQWNSWPGCEFVYQAWVILDEVPDSTGSTN
jgi:hypothetical protein